MTKSMRFIVLLGLVSLFADITYEGSRSMIGPYLSSLGASGAVVGTVAGLGELIGYSMRLVSGYISDKTKRYWLITILGYVINQISVPLLALANDWFFASSLIILERFGKAIRTPSRDVMLSFATKKIGRGKGFGLHAALDQIGAIIGPLFIAFLFYMHSSYQMNFVILLIPATCCLSLLLLTRFFYPNPGKLEDVESTPHSLDTSLPHLLKLYLLGISLVAAGMVDFPLIAFHFEKSGLSGIWIAIFYAVAMATHIRVKLRD